MNGGHRFGAAGAGRVNKWLREYEKLRADVASGCRRRVPQHYGAEGSRRSVQCLATAPPAYPKFTSAKKIKGGGGTVIASSSSSTLNPQLCRVEWSRRCLLFLHRNREEASGLSKPLPLWLRELNAASRGVRVEESRQQLFTHEGVRCLRATESGILLNPRNS